MKTVYYGWIIVGMGVLVKTAGLGFGRFAYPMLLPSMKDSLRFNYTQMGLLSGAILLGYLVFSLIGGALATRFGSKKIVLFSLLAGCLSMFAVSQASSFLPLLFFTFAMGAGAAGVHISMTALPMRWFGKRLLGTALGIITGGTGLAIVFTGLLLPPLLISLGSQAWRQCWVILACTTFAVIIAGSVLLKETPRSRAGDPFEALESQVRVLPPIKGEGLSLRAIFVIYFLFGFAYNIYATYYVAFLMEDMHLTEKTAGAIWSTFGWMCAFSGLMWGFLSDRLGRRRSLLWNHGVISIAVFLPLLFHQIPLLGLSALLFGITFLGTVTIIAACIGDLAVEKKAALYGLVTLIHGIGQLLGTMMGGYLKDLTGSFQLTFLSSLIGFLVCWTLTALAFGNPSPMRFLHRHKRGNPGAGGSKGLIE